MILENYKKLIVGDGRLAAALSYKLDESTIISRSNFEGILKDAKKHSLERYYQNNVVVFYTSAITNPDACYKTINNINYTRAVELHSLLAKNSLLITFGSVLELYPNISNNYVNSKRMLKDFSDMHQNIFHYQLHTLYGLGKPIEHMFLGHIYNAIKFRSQLKMSAGNQYREYQNINTVVDEIILRVRKGGGDSLITFGNPLQLKNLACEILKYFNLENRLEFDYDISIATEIFAKDNFISNTTVPHPSPVEDIVKYLEDIL